jgi:hypothetical protein
LLTDKIQAAFAVFESITSSVVVRVLDVEQKIGVPGPTGVLNTEVETWFNVGF